MRVRLPIAVITAGVLSTACPPDPIPVAGVDLKIVSMTPDNVFNEGGDLITLVTENGCKLDKLTIKVNNLNVPGVQELELNKYSFSAPPHTALDTAANVEVSATCEAHPTPSTHKYGKNTATTTLKYSPDLEPQPSVQTYAPSGTNISVLAQMVVTFSRKMDPATINTNTIGLSGVSGKVEYDANTRTAKFVPNEQLQYAQSYIAFVKGGDQGVRSALRGKTLKTTLKPGGGAPDADKDSWTFTTRCEGCGNPWLGDISAAAGISQGGNYKLFSVTGQPAPVGEAYAGTPENHTYKLQSGFIYATQPANGQ